MFREAGGQYVYFNKSYGDFVGYLYGWAVFIVIQTGSIASIAYVFSDSLGYFFTFPRLGPAWEAVALHIPFIGAMTPFKFIGLKAAPSLPDPVPDHDQLPGRASFGSAIRSFSRRSRSPSSLAIVVLAFTLGHGSLGQLHPVDRHLQRRRRPRSS